MSGKYLNYLFKSLKPVYSDPKLLNQKDFWCSNYIYFKACYNCGFNSFL